MKIITIFLAIALLQFGCESSDDDVYTPPTKIEVCDCYSQTYFKDYVTPGGGQPAHPDKAFYSNDCEDDGAKFPSKDGLVTKEIRIICIKTIK